MDRFNLYAAQLLPFREHFRPDGHNACAGCGIALALRHVCKALADTAFSISDSRWHIPWEKGTICPPVSPAGTSLLQIPKETDPETYFDLCFDNECAGASQDTLIKRQPAVSSACGYRYVATASPSHPFDLIEKVRTGWRTDGPAFIHLLCPCPVAWGFDPQDTVHIGRMAVETRIFPLYEIAGGYYTITVIEQQPRPVKDYIKRQQRFDRMSAHNITRLQTTVDDTFKNIENKADRGL